VSLITSVLTNMWSVAKQPKLWHVVGNSMGYSRTMLVYIDE